MTGNPLETGSSLSGPRGLPPDLLREASRRLELLGRVVGAGFGCILVFNNLLRSGGFYELPHAGVQDLLCLAVMAVSGTLLWLSRSERFSPLQLLDLGLAYEIVVGFAISMGDNLTPLTSDRPLAAISWLCVWIVMFPLVVPASRAKTLLAGSLAASTWPLAFSIGLLLGHPAPPGSIVALNFLENYIAAGLALVPTLILRRLGTAVAKAREMGSYELVERLGQGGMGEVWLARHRLLARPAAVKLIRPAALGLEMSGNDSLVRRFEREARATAALRSPHTVELYDFGVARDGTFYYVMESLDGLDLESVVRRFGSLDAERAVYLLLQACDSLAEAHQMGLVHRDIKPANIFVCRKGVQHDFVKVLDFGLVKSAWQEQEGAPLTVEGAVKGTPAFMAPEVALGSSGVDARADVYGLGCVAYWLVTARRVFEGATPLELALQHIQAQPVPPSKRTEIPLPEGLERIILDCLAKDPARRPASAGVLGSQLADCALASPWSPERARRWWEAHMPGLGDSAAARVDREATPGSRAREPRARGGY